MSESGAGRGGLQRAAAGCRRSQDALASGQPPGPRGAARRQLGPPGVPLPNSWPRPGGLLTRRGGGAASGWQRRGQAQLAHFRAPAAGGSRGRAGPPGRAAGGPRGAPRTKGDGDGSSVVKTTCAGCGPRSGCGLRALRLNPFPAAASPLRLAAGDRASPADSRLGVGSGPPREEAGRDRAIRSPGPSLAPARASSCPAPFPPGFPVDLPTHCYVSLGGVGALIRPDLFPQTFPYPTALAARLLQACAPHPACGGERCFLPLAGCGRRYGWASDTHRPGGWIPSEPPLSSCPTSSPVSTPSV